MKKQLLCSLLPLCLSTFTHATTKPAAVTAEKNTVAKIKDAIKKLDKNAIPLLLAKGSLNGANKAELITIASESVKGCERSLSLEKSWRDRYCCNVGKLLYLSGGCSMIHTSRLLEHANLAFYTAPAHTAPAQKKCLQDNLYNQRGYFLLSTTLLAVGIALYLKGQRLTFANADLDEARAIEQLIRNT